MTAPINGVGTISTGLEEYLFATHLFATHLNHKLQWSSNCVKIHGQRDIMMSGE